MTTRIGSTQRIGNLAVVRWFLPVTLFLAGLAPIPIQARDIEPEPLRIKLELAKEPYFVGQGIILTARVVGEADRPKIDVPKVSGADVWTIETDVTPLSVSGIGQTISQENLFLTRFRLVPRRAGTLEIPPVRVEQGGRVGRSRPGSLAVQTPPIDGRPSSFLGGIGACSIRVEAEPTTLRLGQTLEYRIRLEGPAAWGSTIRPDLGRFDRVPLGLRIEPISNELIAEPPSRTFTYRLRPTLPGEAALPALLVSSFDPKLGRYQTKTTSSVPIRVVAVPGFDPKSIDYRPPPVARLSFTAQWLVLGGSTIFAGVALSAGWWFLRRRIRSRPNKPNLRAARRFASRTVQSLDTSANDIPETARQITEALIRYLELGSGRPPGALTPAEAGRGVAKLTGSTDLGNRAERLLAACDCFLYGEVGDRHTVQGNRSSALLDEARQLFHEMER